MIGTLIKFHGGGKVYTTGGVHMAEIITVVSRKGDPIASFLTKDILSIEPNSPMADGPYYMELSEDGESIDSRYDFSYE